MIWIILYLCQSVPVSTVKYFINGYCYDTIINVKHWLRIIQKSALHDSKQTKQTKHVMIILNHGQVCVKQMMMTYGRG